jgi:DoxX-like protein
VVVNSLAQLGFYNGRLLLIAILEVASVVLFLIPRTRSLGLLLVSAYLGGAIAAHLGHGEPIAPPAIVLSLVWIATAVREPRGFWSFTVTS